MTTRSGIALALLLVLAGCAAGGAGGATRAATDRYLITPEEISAVERSGSAYELIQRIRPAWLRERSAGTPQNPNSGAVVVYMDNLQMGGANQLRQIPVSSLVSLRYLDPGDATTRFGTGHMGGAILVTTRR